MYILVRLLKCYHTIMELIPACVCCLDCFYVLMFYESVGSISTCFHVDSSYKTSVAQGELAPLHPQPHQRRDKKIWVEPF
ncbi:hypothetical protein VNO78_19808 [Psophocarpus tetragonolobus]|uniref:Uncharacterized protein n=1 Tax=Psophocarpus tetragonolobus TaxID=3891 RepID=A0AAN9SCM2_PSOTE